MIGGIILALLFIVPISGIIFLCSKEEREHRGQKCVMRTVKTYYHDGSVHIETKTEWIPEDEPL